MISKKDVSAIIPFYLADNKISAEKLAEDLGVCRQSVYKWLAGKPMSNNNFVALVRLFENFYGGEYVPNALRASTNNQSNRE